MPETLRKQVEELFGAAESTARVAGDAVAAGPSNTWTVSSSWGARAVDSDLESSAPRQPRGEFSTIPVGSLAMGDHQRAGYPADGETPVHEVHVGDLRIGATTVTNADFEEFVQETDYQTTAEQFGVSAVFSLLSKANAPKFPR